MSKPVTAPKRPPKTQAQVHDETVRALTTGELAAYHRITEWIEQSATSRHALKVGAVVPGFALPNAEGRLVVTDSLLAHGPLIVKFCCGGWCPFCIGELHQFQRVLSEIERSRARLVVLTPEVGGFPRKMKARHDLERLELLSDVNYGIALTFGVLYSVPQDVRPSFLSFGLDLEERHGADGWMLPVPSTFVLGHSGVVRDACVEGNILARRSADEIVNIVQKLT